MAKSKKIKGGRFIRSSDQINLSPLVLTSWAAPHQFGMMGDVIPAIWGVPGGYSVALFGVTGTGGIIGSIVVTLPGALLIIRGARKIKV
jgi:hypothetical protein